MKNNIILASESPFRAQLLRNAGVDFETIPARVDERAIEQDNQLSKLGQAARTAHLAAAKAFAVARQYPDCFVIGADQTIMLGQTVLHKPRDGAHLREQLKMMRGKTHRLVSAAVIAQSNEILAQTSQTVKLTMRQFSDEEMEHVIDIEGEKLLKCAGGYQLEGASVQLFEQVDGDYFTVLGLPLLPLLKALRQVKAI
ncbi:Maf family nucleotide pyrophosphatase [Maritalea mediterranea]|uniref:7-methyl-GTP pyrophosphatase n=1 Tax=Maritalea mediterranea TaxID=2909667 RepID=A0ABS9E233_9HYPH|nr:Maf family nucleotide pyrophosphatase [Maritalea mediterranea]MCF4096920.1 Maf family nucleotide pyrophosphatase [Maritalea mediterranea]